MKNLLFIILLTTFSNQLLQAQQLPLFTQYTEMQTFLNPAAISIDYLQYNMNQTAGLTYRLQWVGIEDSPRTGLARYEFIREDNNLTTFGGYILNDRIGASNVTGVYGRYSYQIRPSGNNNLLIGLGIAAGFLQYRLDGTQLEFEADDQLQGGSQVEYLPDFGLGFQITYYPESGTKFYAGAAVPQSVGLRANFRTQNNEEISIKRQYHVYANAGAIFAVGQQGFMEPSVWFKYTQNAPVNIDFNIRQKFVNNFWMGLGYGTSNTLHLEMGLIMTDLLNLENAVVRVGYGFDYNMSAYGNALGTTHELNVSYAWSR